MCVVDFVVLESYCVLAFGTEVEHRWPMTWIMLLEALEGT